MPRPETVASTGHAVGQARAALAVLSLVVTPGAAPAAIVAHVAAPAAIAPRAPAAPATTHAPTPTVPTRHAAASTGPQPRAYTCTYTSAGPVFPPYTGVAVSATITFTVTCSGSGTSTTRITLSTGQSGTYTSRRLTSGANSLNYNIYTDATFTTIWGDGTAGTSFVFPANANNVHNPGTFTITAFALIPGGQPIPPPGDYTDSITATLTCTNGGACTTGASQDLVVPIPGPPAAGCTLSSSNLDFGAYAARATTPLTSQATITAKCPAGTPYMVGLSAGSYPGATTTSRRMALTGGGADTLGYGLYSDPAGTVNWGDSFGGGGAQDVVLGVGSGDDQEIPVYGRVYPGQYVHAGQYEDTVIVTLEF